MKRLVISLLSCIVALVISSNASANLGVIPAGQVVDTVKCIYNRQQSYAVYLPSYYNTNDRYPIIYIFEPAARGALPVQKYHQLAEEFGFILVCSNNSQNGPQDRIDLAYNAVFNDTKIRFTEDTSRFYTMGFSGGARVAARIAVREKNIKGVIACGAGFPHEYRPGKGMNFSFVGLIGDLDMNFSEMKGLESQLEANNIRHSILYYHDNHSWPPVDQMRDAFIFIYFDAMRRNLTGKELDKISEFKSLKINKLSSIGDKCELYQAYKQLSQYLTDLTSTEDIEKKLNELEHDEQVKSCISLEKRDLKQETDMAMMFDDAFYSPEKYDLSWWKKECGELNKILGDSVSDRETLIAQRMVNKIYALAMEYYWIYNQDITTTQMIRLFKIAGFAKPISPYPDYYMASIYAKNNKDGQALKWLEKSIGKGFSNLAYLQEDKSFDNLRKNKKYLELENQIQSE